MELVPPCCGERTCSRTQRPRIAYTPETGKWWIYTEYAELGTNGIGTVRQKHEAHPVDAAWLTALLDRDTGSGAA